MNNKKYLKDVEQVYTNAYKNIYNQQKQLANVIFSGILELTNLDNRLKSFDKNTQEEKTKIQNSVSQIINKRLKTLNKDFLKSIKIISYEKDFFVGTSFVNKEFELYKYVQKNRVPIDTYVIDNNSSGFSFIFPIFDKKNKYLGLIDITFSEQFMTSFIMHNYRVLSNIIIKDSSFDKEFLENNSVYKKAHHKGFLHNKEVVIELQEIAKRSIYDIKPSENTSKTIYEQANSKKTNTMFLDSDDVIITTIPVFNHIKKEQLAFIAIISQGHELRALNESYKTIKILVIVLIALTVLTFYQQNLKRVIQKESFKKIMEKDKQLLEQSKMAQMGEMIGNIAHQWRQPLSAISTVSSGIKLNQELGMLKDEDIPKSMDTIVYNCKYLSETIDTFQDFIKEKKVKDNVLIQERIDESIKIVSATLKNNHIEIIKNIDYDKEVHSKIVGQELSQVIINILNNAKDAIVQRKIENTRFIKIDLVEKENIVQIMIEDGAGGITPENIVKVFDPYFTTKHKFKGTGLGLYMSKTIVEKHFKGELTVRNGKEGAIFTISLPKV
ncbi:sensor histidine kinase [Arcobacter sp. YIC-464]|uniref:sensor histidine kinase n=1 Tax=Arcobacter sp. YIC-464 TaxID=3376631 RepID=UPI003C28DD0C